MNRKLLPIFTGMLIMMAGITGCAKEGESAEQENTEQENTVQERESSSVQQPDVQDGMLQIDSDDMGGEVFFADYDADGTAMQLMLYKDDDNVIHGAFNTCQVCNGSPYAYFEQEGNDVVCQNCGNHFSVEEIGNAHGGCNPVPLEFTQEDNLVQIDIAYLTENASMFETWKQGL